MAPTDLAGLLPSPADVTELTGRDGMSLTLTETELGGFPKKSSFDPPECEGAVSIGSTHVYDPDAVRGYYLTHMDGPTAIFDQSAAAYDSPVAAESALQVMLANWRKCGGTTISWHTHDGVHDTVLEIPADAGNGITTMRFHAHLGPLGTAGVHALAVKANVLVDVTVLPDNDVDDLSNGVAAVAAFILNRIPGPR
ncbi:sensor domain-containing protein [Mycobacterium sp. M1]|uniref:Sensor domain-containing protein n=1 Tax=Mycolicibacter acidiphilus TaxID=2835306 RepID=A0ABS5RN69_9MYCO|nr:sensor domain-containing protein [Mycolicibacter acidiphilus]